MNTTQLIFAMLTILCTSCAAFLMRVSTRHYVPSTSLMSRYHHNNHHCLRILNHNCNQYVKYNDDSDSILPSQYSSQSEDTPLVHRIKENTDTNILSNTYHQYYISDHHSITNRVCNTLFSILVSFVAAISLGVGVSYALDNDIELANGNIQSKFDSMTSLLIAEDQEGQDLYVQLGPKVVLSEEERTIRKIVQSTQQQQPEPTVILTNQKDRRSSSYKPKESPELKVILEDSSPSSKSKTLSSKEPTELKVELENSIPKSEQSAPSQTNAKPLNMIELSDPKKAEVVTIRPQTMEYIKSYKATEKKSEQAKNGKGQEITTKSATNDDAKKTNSKSKTSTTIAEVFNNVKLFSLGLGVGTVAIMTYQKVNEVDTESGEYSKENDIPQQTYQGGMSGAYLDSLNAASSPEATLNRELSSLDKELTALGDELTSLDKYLRDADTTVDEGEGNNQDVAFDGISCAAFNKLSGGEQARRIAEFEARQNNGNI